MSGDTSADNIYVYPGEGSPLEISRVYSTQWLCSYQMLNYPFDTQVRWRHAALVVTKQL